MANPSPSTDAQYLRLDNEIRELRRAREKARPAVYILLAILLASLGFVLPFGLALLVWLFALASVFAAITAASKRSALGKQISDLDARLNSFQGSKDPTMPLPSTSASQRLTELNQMREGNLITEEEFEAKKAQLLKEL